jgi:hypothetical protein
MEQAQLREIIYVAFEVECRGDGRRADLKPGECRLNLPDGGEVELVISAARAELARRLAYRGIDAADLVVVGSSGEIVGFSTVPEEGEQRSQRRVGSPHSQRRLSL